MINKARFLGNNMKEILHFNNFWETKMFIEHILISTKKKIKIDEQFNKIYIVREFEPVMSICHA